MVTVVTILYNSVRRNSEAYKYTIFVFGKYLFAVLIFCFHNSTSVTECLTYQVGRFSIQRSPFPTPEMWINWITALQAEFGNVGECFHIPIVESWKLFCDFVITLFLKGSL